MLGKLKNELKDMVREVVREEVTALVTRDLRIAYGKKQQGDPDGEIIKEETWNIMDFFVVYLPRIEAALRGMQETTDHVKNNQAINNDRVGVMGATLLSMQEAAAVIASLTDKVRNLPEAVRSRMGLAPQLETHPSNAEAGAVHALQPGQDLTQAVTVSDAVATELGTLTLEKSPGK